MVMDFDGWQVIFVKELQCIILQDGCDIMIFVLLDWDNLFKWLVVWNNLVKKQDVVIWQMLKMMWFQLVMIFDMGFSDKGNVDFESVIVCQLDLMIVQLCVRLVLMESGVIDKFSVLYVLVLFVDYEIVLVKDIVFSIDLLGKVFNCESQVKVFIDYYCQQLQLICQKIVIIMLKVNVFVEVLVGNSDVCCFIYGYSGWGGLVEVVGVNNIGLQLLLGVFGFVLLEKIISMKFDVWIMIGLKCGNSQVLFLGYVVKLEVVKVQVQMLLVWSGVSQILVVQEKWVYGVYYYFYNYLWNIVGMEYLVKDIYLQVFGDFNLDEMYYYIVCYFIDLLD